MSIHPVERSLFGKGISEKEIRGGFDGGCFSKYNPIHGEFPVAKPFPIDQPVFPAETTLLGLISRLFSRVIA